MIELHVEISADQMKSEGYRPVTRMDDSKTFPQNTWRYERGKTDVCLAVEVDLKTLRPIRHVNLLTGEVRGYKQNGR